MYIEATKNLELAKFNLLINTPIIQVIDKPIFPLEEKRPRAVVGFLSGFFLGGALFLGCIIIRKQISKLEEE